MKQPETRILISGGGTGGHIFPAIAIAKAIERLQPGVSFLFVGAKGRMEMEKVPSAGYDIKGLWISGLQRKISTRNLLFPFKVISSLYGSWRIIKRFKPQLAIGVGGYASAPALWMAARMGIPTLIQEQNAFPGIANRVLARVADVICVAYDGMEKYFPAERIRLTGNPVRTFSSNLSLLREEAALHFQLDLHKPTLFVVGGSLGALTLNRCVGNMLPGISSAGYQLIWQTGKAHAEQAQEQARAYKDQGVIVLPFIDRMDLAYALSDLVISRAGAIAIAELCVTAKAVILVPSPNVTEDHQRKNAEALVAHQAAVMIRDAEADTRLEQTTLALMLDLPERQRLSNNIRKLANPSADVDIARIALELASKNKKR